MEKQIGLLIMRDENDILEEYLNVVSKYYDPILVLDGSDDEIGREICSKFPEVKYYERDENVVHGVSNDSIRGFLLEKAKEISSDKKWVAVLHPDEFPEGNPLSMLESIDHLDFDSVTIRNLHFFPHTSQRETWINTTNNLGLIEPMLEYCMMPGFPEHRYFRMKPEFAYDNRHSLTIPPQATNSIGVDFCHKHITYRTKDQALKRAKTRIESGWQPVDYVLVLENEDIFFDTLKYSEEVRQKYPREAGISYYNWPSAYVAKIEKHD